MFLLTRWNLPLVEEGYGSVQNSEIKQLEGATQTKCPLTPPSWLWILYECSLLNSLLCYIARVPPHRTLQTPAASCMREGAAAPSLPQQQEKGQVDTVAARGRRGPTILLKDTIHTLDYDRTKIWEINNYALLQK